MERKKDFATRVYELRVLNRMTQKELGEAIGLSGKSICTIESGERKTSWFCWLNSLMSPQTIC